MCGNCDSYKLKFFIDYHCFFGFFQLDLPEPYKKSDILDAVGLSPKKQYGKRHQRHKVEVESPNLSVNFDCVDFEKLDWNNRNHRNDDTDDTV